MATPEARLAGLRSSRMTYTRRRLRIIAETEPRFTSEQVEELCEILRAGVEPKPSERRPTRKASTRVTRT